MSRVLHDAVIQALKEAHEAYLLQNSEKYCECIKVAECGIEAIRLLGIEDRYGRKMELMGLQAELMLLCALADIHNPAEQIPRYEAASLQMLIPPSNVIPREAPLIPHCENTLDFFGGACDLTAESLEQAVGLYGKLTNGGGSGVTEIYRAQIADHRGEYENAHYWANLALKRMCGDKWIEPIAKRLIQKTDIETANRPKSDIQRVQRE